MEVTGKETEINTVGRVFTGGYDNANFSFHDSSRVYIGECLKTYGIVSFFMLEYPLESGFRVEDETYLTVCPGEDDLWFLAEWRVLRSIVTNPRKGIRAATWGQVKQERNQKGED